MAFVFGGGDQCRTVCNTGRCSCLLKLSSSNSHGPDERYWTAAYHFCSHMCMRSLSIHALFCAVYCSKHSAESKTYRGFFDLPMKNNESLWLLSAFAQTIIVKRCFFGISEIPPTLARFSCAVKYDGKGVTEYRRPVSSAMYTFLQSYSLILDRSFSIFSS